MRCNERNDNYYENKINDQEKSDFASLTTVYIMLSVDLYKWVDLMKCPTRILQNQQLICFVQPVKH